MKKITNGLFGVGIPTMIMILMVIALGVFGSLTLVTAYADYQLAKKAFNQTEAIYKAGNEIESLLVLLDEQSLESCLEQFEHEYSYNQELQQLEVYVPIEKEQMIKAIIDLNQVKIIQSQLVSSIQFEVEPSQSFNQIEIGD